MGDGSMGRWASAKLATSEQVSGAVRGIWGRWPRSPWVEAKTVQNVQMQGMQMTGKPIFKALLTLFATGQVSYFASGLAIAYPNRTVPLIRQG